MGHSGLGQAASVLTTASLSYSPLNELLEHIPSEVLANLLNVWLCGGSWELVTKSISPG